MAKKLAWSTLALIVLCQMVYGQVISRPELADDEINRLWMSSRPHNLPTVVMHHNGQILDGTKEIGPIGVQRTLGVMDWPWNAPGGRTAADKSSIKTVWPPSIQARPQQLLMRSNNRERAAWKWPDGSAFFELHMHRRGHPFELRCLRKHRDGYGILCYESRVFAPVIPPHLKKGEVVRRESRRSLHPQNEKVFEGVCHYYDDVNVDWNAVVYGSKWEEVTGDSYSMAGKGDGFVVPKSYQGWILGDKTIDSCKRCHEDFGTSVGRFDARRDWYGFFQGADGIPSFDPIDRRSVKPNHGGLGTWTWKNN